MKDAEIIKALECCAKDDCRNCPARDDTGQCINKLANESLDLINRQKAEIERLRYHDYDDIYDIW